MAILQSLTLAQLQTFEHVLKEMESEGVPTLAEARLRVFRENSARHTARTKKALQPKFKQTPCPDCGMAMVNAATVDSPGDDFYDENRSVKVLYCPRCRYSTLVETA